MHKTHIFDQKNNAKSFLPTYLPYFFRLLQETYNIFCLALAVMVEDDRSKVMLKFKSARLSLLVQMVNWPQDQLLA